MWVDAKICRIFLCTHCIKETEKNPRVEYGFYFFEMVKVNAYKNENNGSYPVLWQFFLKIWNFCVVDQKSVADVGLIDSFNLTN